MLALAVFCHLPNDCVRDGNSNGKLKMAVSPVPICQRSVLHISEMRHPLLIWVAGGPVLGLSTE